MNVITLGSFDCLHPGHIHLFRECSKLAGMGGQVTVAVNTSEFIGQFKAPPVQSLTERLEMVMACRYVDRIKINDGTEQPKIILASQASVIVVGDDWADRDYVGQIGVTDDWLGKNRIRIQYLPRVGEQSSTALKERIRAV